MKDEIINEILRDMEADAEAAWEGTPLRRALVKYAARLREALGAPALAPGNAAAMRAALEFVRDTVLVGWRFPEARERVVAALAAPARNCDRYATVEDAKRAYIAERGHVFIWDGDSSERFERWLFATAAGGAE